MLLLHLLLKELHGIGLDSFADGVNQFLGRKDLFEEGELEKKVVVSKMEITATDDKTFRHRTILWMLLLHQIFFSDHEAIIHGGIILSRIFSTFKVAVRQIKRSLLVVAAI